MKVAPLFLLVCLLVIVYFVEENDAIRFRRVRFRIRRIRIRLRRVATVVGRFVCRFACKRYCPNNECRISCSKVCSFIRRKRDINQVGSIHYYTVKV